jgi:hypothetical protein
LGAWASQRGRRSGRGCGACGVCLRRSALLGVGHGRWSVAGVCLRRPAVPDFRHGVGGSRSCASGYLPSRRSVTGGGRSPGCAFGDLRCRILVTGGGARGGVPPATCRLAFGHGRWTLAVVRLRRLLRGGRPSDRAGVRPCRPDGTPRGAWPFRPPPAWQRGCFGAVWRGPKRPCRAARADVTAGASRGRRAPRSVPVPVPARPGRGRAHLVGTEHTFAGMTHTSWSSRTWRGMCVAAVRCARGRQVCADGRPRGDGAQRLVVARTGWPSRACHDVRARATWCATAGRCARWWWPSRGRVVIAGWGGPRRAGGTSQHRVPARRARCGAAELTAHGWVLAEAGCPRRPGVVLAGARDPARTTPALRGRPTRDAGGDQQAARRTPRAPAGRRTRVRAPVRPARASS